MCRGQKAPCAFNQTGYPNFHRKFGKPHSGAKRLFRHAGGCRILRHPLFCVQQELAENISGLENVYCLQTPHPSRFACRLPLEEKLPAESRRMRCMQAVLCLKLFSLCIFDPGALAGNNFTCGIPYGVSLCYNQIRIFKGGEETVWNLYSRPSTVRRP